MKIILRIILSLLFSITLNIYAQQSALSTDKAPFNKARSHVNYGTFPLSDIAYANDNSTSSNISMPIPDGHPFTLLGSFTGPVFATSMVFGGDGNYYLLDVTPQLYLFDPVAGTCALIGNITGTAGDQPTGLSYNPINNTYYMTSAAKFYSLDINTLTATLIGSFSPVITGLMIDLCFDETGTCYSYDVDINAGAANGYIIDINTAALTTLGYVGFTPNYGQGMSYDYETGTIYLSAFNYDTFTGQLRTMDKNTGMTTLLYDWGDQIAPFAVNGWICCCHPYPGSADNPNPPSGMQDVSINGITLTWDNGVFATMVEVWIGPAGNEVKVYDGPLITSWDTGPLEYFTLYHWKIVEKNDSCENSGANWLFTTEQNPNLHIENFYPQDVQYWTGYTDGSTKTDGEINTVYPNEGWAAYDISSILPGSVVQDVNFWGYVNANNWPYWSATPMGTVNPITDDATAIFNQIFNNSAQGVAYIYSNESGTISNDWHNYPMENTALTDLQNAVNAGQGWFAMGFVDRDGTPTYFINFDGHGTPNPLYIEITYVPIPVELTSFRADIEEGSVVLSWQTATEVNNRGFDVERQVSSKQYAVSSLWEKIGFIEGNGTSTQTHSYSFTDKDVIPGKYSYRLKQIDFDGTSEYSKEVEINIDAPKVYSLEQNYPNPFNPTTQINFSLAQDSKVQLKVFDILGREVAALINGNIVAGVHNVTFNASNLPSGVYIYRLEANGVKGSSFSSVKKMTLMR